MSPRKSFQPLLSLYKRPVVPNLDPPATCLKPRSARPMATVTEPPSTPTAPRTSSFRSSLTTTSHPETSQHSSFTIGNYRVPTTIYQFPTMEPLRLAHYPANHLHLPLRKDILHRAVIYEGDMTRSGTASTKWRDDVHGSHRKLYAQKGTGRARVGDKQSPIRRGGGVAFGPHPRDFATRLPRKVYDLAWRTALSYRYRKGQLVVVERFGQQENCAGWWLRQIFQKNGWGNGDGRSLLVARSKADSAEMMAGVESCGEQGRMVTVEGVDVKNLLEMGRVVIELSALNILLKWHSSDLVEPVHVVAAPTHGHVAGVQV